MSPEPAQRFRCETYLMAFAAGARDGFVREHVDNCYFCHDIVHGGTEEFPLSFDQEVAEVKAARRRQSRRRFLKLTAAGLAGIALIGGGGLVASKYVFHPTQVIEHKRQKRLDKIFSTKGKPGIVAYLDTASVTERMDVHTWISERGHTALLDLTVHDLGHEDESVRTRVVSALRSFAPAQLAPWKTSITAAAKSEPEDALVHALLELVATIP
ncbi:MAG: twin-arginine translocation signal domain-containing protein [Planctomycetes bacterium]|nr:twin-arginine translocation signal domain-containing protein [Planctomycetota bacterium]